MTTVSGVVYDGSKTTVVDDLEVGDPGPGEVRVRTAAAGLCHSDVSVINGTIPFPSPVVLGHEGAGVVEAVGKGVTALAEGDHVIMTTLGNCGHCEHCDRGRPTMCRFTFGYRPQPFTRGAEKHYSFANVSAFAQASVVKEVQAVKIPEDVPLTSACLVGCGVLTGIGAVLQRARVEPGHTVVVIGVGGIGLNVIQGARLAGATRIVAVDTNPGKADIAITFGATEFVNPADTDGDTIAGVKKILPNGADFTFECVGHVGLIRAAIELLDWGGSCVLLGVPEATAEASFLVSGMYLDKAILGCRYGTSQPQRDVKRYVELYRQGKLLLDELVTQTYPLHDFDAALHDMEAGKLARGVLTLG